MEGLPASANPEAAPDAIKREWDWGQDAFSRPTRALDRTFWHWMSYFTSV